MSDEVADTSSEVESSEEYSEEPSATELTPEEYAQYKVRYKVSGQERSESLSDIIRKASLSEGARTKFEEAQAERRRAEALYREAQGTQAQHAELVQLLQEANRDPRVFKHIVRELGAEHLNDFITEYIQEKTEEAQLTPEQLKLREYEARLQQFEKMQEQLEQEKYEQLLREQEAMLQSRTETVYNTLSNELAEAIEKVGGTQLEECSELPDSDPRKQTVYLAMERAIINARNQLKDYGQFADFGELYQSALRQVQSLASISSTARAKELHRMQVEELRKSQMAKAYRYPNEGTPKPSKSSKKFTTINDFFGD
jgi:hypothetical protein